MRRLAALLVLGLALVACARDADDAPPRPASPTATASATRPDFGAFLYDAPGPVGAPVPVGQRAPAPMQPQGEATPGTSGPARPSTPVTTTDAFASSSVASSSAEAPAPGASTTPVPPDEPAPVTTQPAAAFPDKVIRVTGKVTKNYDGKQINPYPVQCTCPSKDFLGILLVFEEALFGAEKDGDVYNALVNGACKELICPLAFKGCTDKLDADKFVSQARRYPPALITVPIKDLLDENLVSLSMVDNATLQVKAKAVRMSKLQLQLVGKEFTDDKALLGSACRAMDGFGK